MKVNLSAQTISASVSHFADCEPTWKFLETFDWLFDMMNSRNSIGRGFKSPLRQTNERTNKAFLMEAYNYIIGLKEPGINGRPIVATGKKTAFLVAIKSFKQLYDMWDHQHHSYSTCWPTNLAKTTLRCFLHLHQNQAPLPSKGNICIAL